MKGRPITAWGVATMAVVLASGVWAPGQVQARTQAGGYVLAVSHPLATPAQAASITEFWLAHNGRALISATPYAPETGIAARRAGHDSPVPRGKPGMITAVAETKRVSAARGTSKEVARPNSGRSGGSGTSKNVNLPRTIGKVFFIGADNRPHWCSATSVRSDHANLVATAGHCVYDLGHGAAPLRNWVFIPGYRQGKAPWGVYVGRQAFTHRDFATYGDADRDYAFVTVHGGLAPRRSGLVDTGRLGDRVGGQGLAYNLRVGKPLVIIGHLARGGALTHSYGTSFGAADPAIRATELVGMRSTREAASGSPWFTGYRNTRGLGYLNGLTIGISGSGGTATATSPYFDGELYAVYDAARRFRT